MNECKIISAQIENPEVGTNWCRDSEKNDEKFDVSFNSWNLWFAEINGRVSQSQGRSLLVLSHCWNSKWVIIDNYIFVISFSFRGEISIVVWKFWTERQSSVSKFQVTMHINHCLWNLVLFSSEINKKKFEQIMALNVALTREEFQFIHYYLPLNRYKITTHRTSSWNFSCSVNAFEVA